MKRIRVRSRLARAAVAVEMAIVTPVLLTMLFGIIEFGWLFTVRSTMVNAAREGARLGALTGVSSAEVSSRATELLVPMHLENRCSIAVTMPTDVNPTVTVQISAPRSAVSLVGNFFGFTTGTITGEASMRREGM
ncbi:MAG: pilus assembly protein [Planctomycetes bacterium]|nr:pilus assembly protein [Planctomycetota bacterium]